MLVIVCDLVYTTFREIVLFHYSDKWLLSYWQSFIIIMLIVFLLFQHNIRVMWKVVT
jgi:hypothetical protein